MKKLLRKILPKFIFTLYHWLMAQLAAAYYRHPSAKLIVIGVTGTNGKSSTVNLLARCLEAAGFKVGFTTTINFKVGGKEWLNTEKMTMLGRFKLQKLLAQMVQAGCRYAVIETSSEGIKQFRHLGIDYDAVIFTNLTPEHIESHGSFENYKKAKLKLFKHLERINKPNKKIIVNLDDPHAADFLNFRNVEKIGFTTRGATNQNVDKTFEANSIQTDESGSSFIINNQSFQLNLIGNFYVYNALAAITTANSLGVDLNICAQALDQLAGIPGRMEFITAGQPFKILVDYAPEPESLKQLYRALELIKYQRLIHVLGSCGGGRDIARRPILGQLAATKADVVIITNEDPYDDDPEKIINDVAAGAAPIAQLTGKSLYKIIDRRAAINKALTLARADDLVLITGKGAEQAICVANGKKIPWDDRLVVREELEKIK